MTCVNLSTIGVSLILLEGQLENAMREERRWRTRREEAARMEREAILRRDRISDQVRQLTRSLK